MSTPPTRSARFRWPCVFAGGLAWAILFTAAVAWLVRGSDLSMRCYLKGVIPVSAIVTGWMAAMGYPLIAKAARLRIPRRMTVLACIACPALYAAQEYASFLLSFRAGTATPGGFWPWLVSRETRSILDFFPGGPGGLREVTGQGIGWRIVECAGYLIGGMVTVTYAASLPWCSRCSRAMSDPLIRDWYPAISLKSAKKSSREAKLRAIAEVREEAQRVAEEEMAAVHRLSSPEVLARISRYAPPPPLDPVTFLAAVRFSLCSCPCCGAHQLSVKSYLPDPRLRMRRIRHRWTKTRTADSLHGQASAAMPAMA